MPSARCDFIKKYSNIVAVYQEDGFIQAQTPGSRDVLVFEERVAKAWPSRGGSLISGFVW